MSERSAIIARVTAGILAALLKDRDQGKLTAEQFERSALRLAPLIREACAEALRPKVVERCVKCPAPADTIKAGLPYCAEHAALVPRPALPTGMVAA